jgi:hypothetical protein
VVKHIVVSNKTEDIAALKQYLVSTVVSLWRFDLNLSSQIRSSATTTTQQTMRIAITPAFDKFLMNNSTVYPYSKLKPTRNSCFCKWVMVKGEHNGLEEYFPVLANSLPNGVLLDLISSDNGKPFPPELSDIMDSMYWWGKTKNYEWYEDCIEVLGESLWSNQKELVRTLISIEVRAVIYGYFAVDSIVADLLWFNWLSWFNATYQIAPKSFHGMAKYSFEYINWSIAQVNYHAVSQVNSA